MVKIVSALLVAALLIPGCAKYDAMPITPAAVEKGLSSPKQSELRVLVRDLHHPLLQPIDIESKNGLTPDQVAIIAVVANPALRAARDQRGLAAAQVLQAGILPNPQFTGAASTVALRAGTELQP